MEDPLSGKNDLKEIEMRRNSFQKTARSLPNLFYFERDENESDSDRNSAKSEHQSNQSSVKNFKSASKSLSLKQKKKVFAEWTETSPDDYLKKPSNLGHKMGISDSHPNTVLHEMPSLCSSKCSSQLGDVNVEDESFVPDSATKPYDPLTNYLSPRPKFLRYNPTRRREAVLLRHRDQFSRVNPCVSLDSPISSVYSSRKSSIKPELGGRNGHRYQQEEVENEEKEVEKVEDEDEHEEEEEEREEEMEIGEQKWGMKWELLKSLIVFAILVLSTMYISSMNLPEPPLDVQRLQVDYQESGNVSFRSVSLMNLEFSNYPFDGREKSEVGMSEIVVVVREERSYLGTVEMGDAIEGQKIEEVGDDYDGGTDNQEENCHNESTLEMYLVSDLKSNESISKDEKFTNEVEFEAERPIEGIIYKGVELEPKFLDEPFDNQVKMFPEDPHLRLEDKIVESKEEPEVICESKEGETFPDYVVDKKFWSNPNKIVWVAIPLLITWGVTLVVKLYLKCKKASSKTTSSKVKFRVHDQVEKTRSRLPPKAGGGKTIEIPKSSPEMNLPSCLHSRVIPEVQMLAELVVGAELQSTPMPAKVAGFGPSPSSYSRSYVSPEKAAKMEDVQEEGRKMSHTITPLRRSSRLRNKGVTSP